MDLSLLPDVVTLTIFIVAFRPLLRRVGTHADVWFLGWTFLLLHTIAHSLHFAPGFLETLTRLIALWSLDLCALSFLVVCANVPAQRIGTLMKLELAVPVLVQSALYILDVPWPLLHYFVCALFFAPAFHMLLVPQRRSRPLVLVSAAFAAFAVFMLPIAWRNPQLVSSGSLALLLLSSAYLYLISATRITRAVVAAVAGLICWAITFPLAAGLTHFYPGMHIDHALLRLPQFLIAAGVMLSLLEEHMLRTERMAMHDPLTDLPNRRLFEERLIATMEEARVNRTTVACLVIDVDNFKTINDTLGHTAGDQLLRALAVRLSWHMSPRDILARTGGDEFTALLAGVNDEHHLRFIASAMMSAASVPIVIDDKPVDVRISVGIALSPDDADDIDSLRRAADEAMYSAKRRGGSLLAFAGKE